MKFERTEWGACSTFNDGASYGATPHDKPHYHALAHRLGYQGDILRYCQEHELAHHLVAEHFNSHSLVLWALAHGERSPPAIAAAEEGLAMALQRYTRTNEHPFIDCVDWGSIRAKMERLCLTA